MKENVAEKKPQAARQEGQTVTGEDGKQYFVIGKTRIKITEHFLPSGKPIEELVTELIEHKIRGKAGDSA